MPKILRYNSKNKSLAQELRRKATRQENHLWYDYLRTYPIQFRRQKQIANFIVDFYCARARLVIELDGSQHYTEDGEIYDINRTDEIQRYGIEVLRFSNIDIDKNFEGVCLMIDEKVKERVAVMLPL